MKRFALCGLFAIGAILASGLFQCTGVFESNCAAQIRVGIQNPNEAELLLPPRSVRQQIREADEAIQQERHSDAVVRLGNLLRRVSRENLPETAQDYFIDPALSPFDRSVQDRIAQDDELQETKPQRVGGQENASDQPTVMRMVRAKIGQLPASGLELYELRYGPLAAKTLKDAESTRDWHAVEQVRREFFHTEAGYEASFLLAMREWQLGNPLATLMLLTDVVSTPQAVQQLGDQVVWLHAGSQALTGRTITTPARWPADVSNDRRSPEAWGEIVSERFSQKPITAQSDAHQYAMFGGRPDRNGVSGGQMPLSNPRWMLETSGSPRQERLIESETEQLKATGLLPPPSWTPLRVGDQLLMRTTQRLLGVDQRTGKRVWQYPWFSPPESVSDDDDEDSGSLRRREDPNDILAQRVWNDVPYGQLSSDGQRVYMIDNLEQIQIERINPFGMRGVRSIQASKNTLVALDVATEGKLLWRLGDVENAPSPLADAFFLGPPLPVRGRLYVMAELAGEILLICLDPANGSEEWRQVLVSIESSGITSDPVRRVAGAMPTYHNGLLICPTGTGVTVAVDLVDRTLRWVHRQSRNQDFVRNVFRPPPEVSMTQLSQRWASSVAIAEGNHIALTPVESDRLIILDAVTGKTRFQPQARIKNLYLAGIRNDQYIIARADRVMGYDIHSGDEVWSTPNSMMRSSQRVSGRGVFGKTSYFLPTSTNELIEISIADGTVLSRRTVRFPLGNLIVVDGEIVSQGTTTLAVAYGQDSLEPIVDRILETDPDDFFATVRKAELLMELDQREPALALLAKARSIDPENDEVILLSVEAMLGSLREKQTLSDSDLNTLKTLIDRPDQKAELLVLQSTHLLQNGDQTKAFKLLLELSDLLAQYPSIDDQQSHILPLEGRQFRLSSWVSARVAEIASTGNEQVIQQIGQDLTDHLDQVTHVGQSNPGRRLEHFAPLASIINSERQLLLNRYLRQGDYLACERLAWATELPTDDQAAKLGLTSLLALAKTYSRTAWSRDRNHIAELLQTRDGLQPNEMQNILDTLEEFRAVGVSRNHVEWPSSVSLQWQSTRARPIHGLTSDRRYAKTVHLMGQTTVGWQAISDNNPLALLEQNGIARTIPVEGLTARNSSDKEVTISGGLMLVLTPSELIAIDLFRVLAGGAEAPVRWRRSHSPDGQPVAKLRSETSKFGDEVYRYLTNTKTANADEAQLRLGPVLGDRLFLLQGNELACFHCVTGEPLWRSDIGAPGSGVVARDGRVAVLSERNNEVITFDWHDGRRIESKPLLISSMMTAIGSHALLVSKYDASQEESPSSLHDPYIVEIFDPISMQRVRHRIASPVNLTDQDRTSGYGELIEGRYFTLLDNEGHATIWDVLSGKELADVNLPIRPKLFRLSTMRLQDRFLLLPRCKLSQTTLRTVSSITVAGGASVQGVTSVHSIKVAQDNGKPTEASQQTEPSDEFTPSELTWSRSFDSARGVTTHQPYATPMLLLTRGHFYNISATSRRRELDVWGLNVENGETLVELEQKQINSPNSKIETDVRLLPHRNQILATVQSEMLTFTFSDKPASTPGEQGSGNTSDNNADNEPGSDEAEQPDAAPIETPPSDFLDE
ncbi:Outer membrane protein assembly factor BamB, contains PQQ-like beta-propeller repeat [Neorhodopirellula lusitana]|uniref:Outer membrane protein assembly factor BamB, contains PQQ-like beta-propeller repeat n=1 Tax=Neorhodopirellula lusitana TaxID=445327 RepID=A0ABY1QSJ0_9BACT|nr:PQQ-binding-like beta-propeller repeat protein [Neorhodopirellula lusitana]SMP76458.1 Outer membrane protein assembly factor BamB, contains PQQ-like beta-propeller repeat [Neorhodopirellula lusitana]